jgi:hypothetical protein
MQKFQGNFLESLITLGIVISRLVKLFPLEEMISIISSSKGSLFSVLAICQRLSKLLSPQIVSPSVLILSFKVGYKEWSLFSIEEKSVFAMV